MDIRLLPSHRAHPVRKEHTINYDLFIIIMKIITLLRYRIALTEGKTLYYIYNTDVKNICPFVKAFHFA